MGYVEGNWCIVKLCNAYLRLTPQQVDWCFMAADLHSCVMFKWLTLTFSVERQRGGGEEDNEGLAAKYGEQDATKHLGKQDLLHACTSHVSAAFTCHRQVFYTHTHTHARTHTHTRARARTHERTYTHTRKYDCSHIQTRARTLTHARTHTHTHTHTHTNIHAERETDRQTELEFGNSKIVSVRSSWTCLTETETNRQGEGDRDWDRARGGKVYAWLQG